MLCYVLFISLLGPAESLFQESYYELMKKALKPDGLLCCQGKHLIFVCTKHMIEQALPLTKIDIGHCFFSNQFNMVQEITITVKPLLNCHPQANGVWPLKRVWPLNRGRKK